MYWKKIGCTGVDSGSLLITDPCYIKGEYGIPDGEALPLEHSPKQILNKIGVEVGVSAPTPGGDGCYDVYGLFTEGRGEDRPLAMVVIGHGCAFTALKKGCEVQ
jgi:hypothetical protein